MEKAVVTTICYIIIFLSMGVGLVSIAFWVRAIYKWWNNEG